MSKGFYSAVAFCLVFLFAAKTAEACIFCGNYDGSCIVAKALTLDKFQAVKGLRPSELVKTEAEVKAGVGKKTGVTVSVFCQGNGANIATCVAKNAQGNTVGTPGKFKLNESGRLVVQN